MRKLYKSKKTYTETNFRQFFKHKLSNLEINTVNWQGLNHGIL
jgi:hypothetical protein